MSQFTQRIVAYAYWSTITVRVQGHTKVGVYEVITILCNKLIIIVIMFIASKARQQLEVLETLMRRFMSDTRQSQLLRHYSGSYVIAFYYFVLLVICNSHFTNIYILHSSDNVRLLLHVWIKEYFSRCIILSSCSFHFNSFNNIFATPVRHL